MSLLKWGEIYEITIKTSQNKLNEEEILEKILEIVYEINAWKGRCKYYFLLKLWNLIENIFKTKALKSFLELILN